MRQSIAWNTKELENQYNYFGSGHWFDKDTMRFFQSRLTEQYRRLDDTNAVFITTEKGPNGIRKASIRHAKLVTYIRESDGRECNKIEIDTVGEFNSLTLSKAKTQLKKLTLKDLEK